MHKAEVLQQWLDKGSNELRSAIYLSNMHYPTPVVKLSSLCNRL